MKRLNWLMGATLGLALAALGAGSALGQGWQPDDNRVIPYQGVVELNGERLAGVATFRFTLREGAAPDTAEVWRSDPLEVELADGRFSMLLGEKTALPENAFDRPALYLSIEIQDVDTGDWVQLANAQRIVPVPYAHLAARAPAGFRATTVQVADTLTVGGTATVAKLSVTGPGGIEMAPNTDISGLDRLKGKEHLRLGIGDREDVRIETTGMLNALRGAQVEGTLEVTNAASVGQLSVTGSGGIALKNNTDISGLDQLKGYDDLRLGIGDREDVRIEKNGRLRAFHGAHVDSSLTVAGSIHFNQSDTDWRRMRLWKTSVLNGNHCNSACGRGYCLGAYVDNTKSDKRSCTETSRNKNCICVGRP